MTHKLERGKATRWLNTTLRTRSAPLLDGLARAASADRYDAAQLLRAVLDGAPTAAMTVGPVRAATTLATVWAIAGTDATLRAGHRLLREVLTAKGPTALSAAQHRIFAQAAYHVGDIGDVDYALRELDLNPDVRWALRVDLLNPLRGASDPAAWTTALAEPFVAAALAPVIVTPGAVTAFDGLVAASAGPTVDGPMVSVIVPAFRPDDGLVTSIHSILAQTHANLEILLVDDASGPDFTGVFDSCAGLDDRVRLIRQPVNGGSYLARNTALRQARGEFITIQDADDWSHPSRLAHQVQILRADPSLGASRSDAVRATDDLLLQWIGYLPRRHNASSLMFRHADIDRIGPFDAVRKGADSEYHERLKYFVGPIGDSHTPLAVTRLRAGSLSRGDFTYQRMAPDRVLYQAAYRAWHRRLRETESMPSSVGDPSHRPFAAPPSFLRGITDVPAREVDVLLVLDGSRWTTAGVALSLVASLTGARVGMMFLEDPMRARAEQPLPVFTLMTAVNDGAAMMVSQSEPVRARTTIVLTPGILVLPPTPAPAVTTGALLAIAPLPTGKHGVTDFVAAADGARAWFSRRPQWCAPDTNTQQQWHLDGWAMPLLTDELTIR